MSTVTAARRPVYPFPCPVCPQRCRRRSHRRAHLRHAHPWLWTGIQCAAAIVWMDALAAGLLAAAVGLWWLAAPILIGTGLVVVLIAGGSR